MNKRHKTVILTNVIFACLFLIGAFGWLFYQANASKSMQTVQIKTQKTSTLTSTSTDKRICIPALKIKNKIRVVNNKRNLAKGVVQQYAKQTPNGKTNFILAGHNLVYQQKFFTNLINAKPKMRIYLNYNGKKMIYAIDTARYVRTNERAYLNPSAKYTKITLYTCTKDSQQNKRFLVEGHLIKQK